LVVLKVFVYFTIKRSLFYNCLDLEKGKVVISYRYFLSEPWKNYTAYSPFSFLSKDRMSKGLAYFYLLQENY
jgi:hypothetical protein